MSLNGRSASAALSAQSSRKYVTKGGAMKSTTLILILITAISFLKPAFALKGETS